MGNPQRFSNEIMMNAQRKSEYSRKYLPYFPFILLVIIRSLIYYKLGFKGEALATGHNLLAMGPNRPVSTSFRESA